MKAKINTFHPIFDFVPDDTSPSSVFKAAGFAVQIVLIDSSEYTDSDGGLPSQIDIELDEPPGYTLAGLYENDNLDIVACWIKPDEPSASVFLEAGNRILEEQQ